MNPTAVQPLSIAGDAANVGSAHRPTAAPTVLAFAPKKSPRTRHGRDRMTFLTPEETLAVLKTARARSVRDWAIILLAYRHGLRASEVCNLKLVDIDPKALGRQTGYFRNLLEHSKELAP
jgi:integrase